MRRKAEIRGKLRLSLKEKKVKSEDKKEVKELDKK